MMLADQRYIEQASAPAAMKRSGMGAGDRRRQALEKSI